MNAVGTFVIRSGRGNGCFEGVVATLVSGFIGYISIWFLLAYLRRNSTLIFIVYRVILGTVILVLLWQGIISPVIGG